MSEEKWQRQDKGDTFTRTAPYREPVQKKPGPTVTKDESYREPRPQGGNQGNDQK
jgi:hypothetical protein